jgi:hypothetical protein
MGEERLATLQRLTERCCVVYQTLPTSTGTRYPLAESVRANAMPRRTQATEV